MSASIGVAGDRRLRLRMLAKRIIPCLDVNHGRVVKGTNFLNLKDAGDPVEVAARYDEEGADELVFLDITASHEDRAILLDVVRRTAEVCFMPLTVGGGIRSLDDIRTLLSAGADKVSINSAAVRDPDSGPPGRAAVRQPVHRRQHRSQAGRARRPRSLGGPHQRRPGADRAGGGLVGAGGRAAGGRRDRADQHGRRRDPERLRPGDDPRRGRRRRRSRWWPPAGRGTPSTCGPSWPRRAPAPPWPRASSITATIPSARPRTTWRAGACPSGASTPGSPRPHRQASPCRKPEDLVDGTRSSSDSQPTVSPWSPSSAHPGVLPVLATAGVHAHGDGHRSTR